MTLELSVHLLRDAANTYRLNKLAAQERGDNTTALVWAQMAIVLHEVANALEAAENSPVPDREAA